MAHRNNPLCLKWITGCLAAVLIVGMAGCVRYPLGPNGCGGEQAACCPVRNKMATQAFAYYPDAVCHGYRATVWHPWPEDCLDCGQMIYEFDESLFALDAEVGPAAPEVSSDQPEELPAPTPIPMQAPAGEEAASDGDSPGIRQPIDLVPESTEASSMPPVENTQAPSLPPDHSALTPLMPPVEDTRVPLIPPVEETDSGLLVPENVLREPEGF